MRHSNVPQPRHLAATETNIAYRTADFERWQDFDFVVGIEIKLSNNHTLNGKPFHDICDKLKGKTGHRISEFSMFPEQRELLFDKGMHLKFESVRKMRSGRIIFRMTEI